MEIRKEYLDEIGRYGQLIVISGPAGGGRHTIAMEYLKDHPHATFVTRITTREKKDDEVDGKEYFFVSSNEFERMIRVGQTLDYYYKDNIGYGTSKHTVEEVRKEGRNVLMITEAESAVRIRALVPDVTLIFIMPASLESLNQQLRNTGKYSEKEIGNYMDMAEESIACSQLFDYILINDEVDKTVRRLTQIVHGNRYSLRNMRGFLKKYVEDEIDSRNKEVSKLLKE